MWSLALPLLSLWSADGGRRGDIVMVPSPGLTAAVDAPAVRALRRRGYAVHRVSWTCAPGGIQERARALAHAIEHLEAPIVVAHGLGATIALSADLDVAGWVLVGPVVDVLPVEDTVALTAGTPGARVRMEDASDEDRARLDRLLGDASAAGCLPGDLAAEVAAWVARGPDPMDRVPRAPAVVIVGAGDDVAPVEAVIPVVGTWPDTTVVRVGLGSWNRADPDHVDLVGDGPGARIVRRAVGAVRR